MPPLSEPLIKPPKAHPGRGIPIRLGAVDQAGADCCRLRAAEKPVVFVERSARPQCEQLIQGTILLRPVARFFTLLPWKPLRDFQEFAVDRAKRRKRVGYYEPVQVRVLLPSKGCLQDLVYLTQCQAASELESSPNLRLAVDQRHANIHDGGLIPDRVVRG